MVLNKVSEVIENAGLNAVEHVALRGRPLAPRTEALHRLGR
jgi:hypothetical protein